MENTLHAEFYDFRDRVWKAFEELVRNGSDILGELPIIVGEYSLPPNGLREGGVHLTDTTDISITGIQANEDYAIFPPKESEKDIVVTTNRVTVFANKYTSKGLIEFEIEVEPDILNLQSLSTYISGGFALYNK